MKATPQEASAPKNDLLDEKRRAEWLRGELKDALKIVTGNIVSTAIFAGIGGGVGFAIEGWPGLAVGIAIGCAVRLLLFVVF